MDEITFNFWEANKNRSLDDFFTIDYNSKLWDSYVKCKISKFVPSLTHLDYYINSDNTSSPLEKELALYPRSFIQPLSTERFFEMYRWCDDAEIPTIWLDDSWYFLNHEDLTLFELKWSS